MVGNNYHSFSAGVATYDPYLPFCSTLLTPKYYLSSNRGFLLVSTLLWLAGDDHCILAVRNIHNVHWDYMKPQKRFEMKSKKG
jgi:hypothetical protein